MIATGNWGTCDWTISEDGEMIIGGGAAESVSTDGKYPWDDYREKIRRISFDGTVTGIVGLVGAFMNCSELEEIDLKGLDISNTVDLSWLFCGCGKLKKIDLTMLDTGRVADMSCMFFSCRELREVNFGGIDTSMVMDMSRMFMYCSNLKTLDMSGLDNSSLRMADDMLFGCDSLRALVPGENFSMGGTGRITIVMPEGHAEEPSEEAEGGEEHIRVSDWRTSKDGVLYIAGTDFTVSYDGNGGEPLSGAGEDASEELSRTCPAGSQVRAGKELFEAPEDRVFKEWNTRRDGGGRKILPGQLFSVHSDMTLYSIWAGRPVFVKVPEIPNTDYGRPLELEAPEIDPQHAEITSLRMEISRETGEWTEFKNEEPLPVSRSGDRIRYIAENYVGSTVSEERTFRINRATYDMSGARWVLPEDLSYDGSCKEVHLEGLPEGITAEYAGNSGTAVGKYTARVILRYDEDNYYAPEPVKPLQWEISRGRYDMSDLEWSYMEAFTYDGTSKSVRLGGLPEGTVPYYSGADAVNAGTYVATAGLDYDIDNYSSPDPVRPCTWKILKSSHDMSDVHWEGPQTFVYDGTPKKVELNGLPEGMRAEYTGNVAVDAGTYTARAAFVPDDPVNYEIPEPVSFSWEIRKASLDMSGAAWSESSLVYNGDVQTIFLEGVPEGVSVLYEGNEGTEVGSYTARAEFCLDDLNNYQQMDPIMKKWEIRKADIDLSRVRWNYSSPYIYNGMEKSVELKNLPEEITGLTYTGARARNAGTYVAKAIFEYDPYNYNPPVIPDCRWTILKANLKIQDLHWNYERPFVYNGGPHSVEITDLPRNAAVSYEGATEVKAGIHTALARITPLDPVNFNTPQPVRLQWKIDRAVFDISGFAWDLDRGRTFDGSSKSVAIDHLPEGVSVSYEGNEAVDAGDYTAKAVFAVEDSANYIPPEPEEVVWNIAPAPIDLKGVTWDYSGPFTYDGSEKEILLQGLPEGVTAHYTDNVASEAGEYAAKAVLVPPEGSNYRETQILGRIWRIDRADIDVSGVHWDCPEDFVYDGMLKKVSLTGLPDSVKAVYRCNEAVDAGSYFAEADLIPYDSRNLNPPTVRGCSWKIGRASLDLSGVRWSGFDTFVHDGTVHKVVLKGLPEELEAIYEGNEEINAGNYVAMAEFRPKDQRNYNTPPRMQYEWSVAKGQLKADSVYWTSGGDELIYDGKEHSIWLAGLPEGVRSVCRGNTAVDAGQYIASAVLEPEDQNNFLPLVIEPYRWEIEPAEIDISTVMWASSGELVYDGTMKVVGLTGLPEDISVEYENNVATNAGTYHASAVLSTTNNNYAAPKIDGCTWTIEKAVPDISAVVWSYAFEFTYDGYEKVVELLDLPEGMTARYRGNTAIEAGEYTASAVLIMDDAMNYEAPEVQPLVWRIARRDYDFSSAVWTGDNGTVYDGTVKSVRLEGLEESLEPIYQGNEAVDAGVYTASVRFLYDEDNYNPPQDLTFTWEIRKAPLDVSGVRWNYDGPFKASGRTRTVSLQTEGPEPGFLGKMLSRDKVQSYPGLPEGTTVRYEGNSAREAGVYEARAYLSIPPQPNHEVTEPICLTWEIKND